MKTRTSLTLFARNRYAVTRRGVALLLVLGCLVLLTTLILAFLISGQSNLKSSKLYANGSSVKTLADSTVNIVMAQIQQATSNGTQVAWASQPGMIRTYSNAGAPLMNYRLYSWDQPSTTGSFDVSTDETQISNAATTPWYSSPSVFVDLNQPVADSTGTPHYPIIDGNPSDFASYTGPGTAGLPVNTYTPYTTTYNGATVTVPQIDGFWVTPPGAAATTGSTTVPPTPAGPAVATAKQTLAGSPVANIVPMPVKWLYVLQDGTVAAPASTSSGSTVTISAATATNPIVGRIAYWTDDETAKININTASEGNFSDTPRAQGITDFALARFPAVQNEYQRYPGHPAMTCLSGVLGSLYNNPPTTLTADHSMEASGAGYTPPAAQAATYGPYGPYYDLNPRLNVNSSTNLGSQAGTTIWSTSTTAASTPNGLGYLTTKSDRLFTSVDELMFASNLFTDTSHTASVTPSGTGGSRPLSKTGNYPNFTQAFLQKARFFLTTNSRAPDVNLFNQPRVITWPISSVANDPTYRTIYDRAIAFCGTIGNLPYYFQRSRNDHPTNDLPPNYAAGATDLTRNRALIQYLQGLTSQSIPGFGGNFLSKYPNGGSGTPTDRDQILTEIFDYVRCLNLLDQSDGTTTFHPFAPIASTAAPWNYSTQYATAPLPAFSISSHAGQGVVVPIYDTQTKAKGFGRFPTLSEASLIFICTGWNDGAGGLITDVNAAPNAGVDRLASEVTNGFTSVTTTPAVPPATGLVTNGWFWGYYNSVATNGIPVTVPPSPAFETIQPTLTALPAIPAKNVQLQACLLLNWFDPSQGNVQEANSHSVQVIGLDAFTWGPIGGPYSNMGFPGPTGSSTACTSVMASTAGSQLTVGSGGNLGFRSFMASENAGLAPTNAQYYPFISTVKNFPYTPGPTGGGTFTFNGGDITINVLLPVNTPNWNSVASVPAGWPTNSQTPTRPPIQQIKITFPSSTLPLPTYATAALRNDGGGSFGRPCEDRGNMGKRLAQAQSNLGANAEFITAQDLVRSVRAYPGDIRMIAGQVSISDTQSLPVAAGSNPGYFDSTETEIKAAGVSTWDYFNPGINLVHSLRESVDYPFWGAILGQLVPVQSPEYVLQNTGGSPIINNYGSGLNASSGAGNNATTTGAFIGGGTSGKPGDWDNGFGYASDGPYINKPDEGDFEFVDPSTHANIIPYFSEATYNYANAGQTFFSPNRLMSGPGMFGSLSTGVARNIPWQTLLFCPNPPAGVSHPGLGTLNTSPSVPTDTPNPGTTGYSTPPDHLILDLFTMPVVEPYPISEPLSTAGRINMNYQIAPFSYIERSTGLRAVLKAERLTVIPDSAANAYKSAVGTGAAINTNYDYRVPINADQTLLAFDNFFAINKDIFRSASQICSMFLYPQRDALVAQTGVAGPLWDADNKNILNFWNGNLTGTNGYGNMSQTAPTASSWPTHYLTGDNSREKTYANIYPRLTTKSNTFTVHYYVQTLQKIVGSSPTQWNEATDQVTGEYRGSTTIERYVDPNSSSPPMPDFTSAPTTALDQWYKFRVINTKQFAP